MPGGRLNCVQAKGCMRESLTCSGTRAISSGSLVPVPSTAAAGKVQPPHGHYAHNTHCDPRIIEGCASHRIGRRQDEHGLHSRDGRPAPMGNFGFQDIDSRWCRSIADAEPTKKDKCARACQVMSSWHNILPCCSISSYQDHVFAWQQGTFTLERTCLKEPEETEPYRCECNPQHCDPADHYAVPPEMQQPFLKLLPTDCDAAQNGDAIAEVQANCGDGYDCAECHC